MITKDDIMMVLFQNISPEAVRAAKENGTLLSYFGGIADRLLGMNVPAPANREQLVYNAGNEMFRERTKSVTTAPEAIKKAKAFNDEGELIARPVNVLRPVRETPAMVADAPVNSRDGVRISNL